MNSGRVAWYRLSDSRVRRLLVWSGENAGLIQNATAPSLKLKLTFSSIQ